MGEYYSAFDKLEEIEIENVLIKWLNDAGYSVLYREHPNKTIELFRGHATTGIVLSIDDEKIYLYCNSTLIVESSIYDAETFGRLSSIIKNCIRDIETLAKGFDQYPLPCRRQCRG